MMSKCMMRDGKLLELLFLLFVVKNVKFVDVQKGYKFIIQNIKAGNWHGNIHVMKLWWYVGLVTGKFTILWENSTT